MALQLLPCDLQLTFTNKGKGIYAGEEDCVTSPPVVALDGFVFGRPEFNSSMLCI